MTQEGGEEIKRQLEDIRNASLGVTTSQISQAKSTRGLARDAQLLNMHSAYQTRIWLAQHPVVNNLTRAWSTFGSVSRGILSITTAFSTAILAFNSTQSGLAQISADLEQARREQALALETYGYDSEEYANATEEVNKFNAAMDEMTKQRDLTQMLAIGNIIATVGIGGKAVLDIVVKVAAFFAAGGALSVAMAAGIALFSLLAAVIGAVALAFYLALTPGDQFQQFINQFFPEFAADIEYVGKVIDDVFTMHIPNAFINFINFWGRGLEHWINMNIGAVNALIKGVNKIARAVNLPTIALIPEWDYKDLDLMKSRNWGAGGAGTFSGAGGATGINTADMIAGGMHPHMGGAGQTIVVNVHNAGSVLSVMELNKSIDKALKQTLKDHGHN